nr:MAG TPA: hypothetical protein [Caudoviricetes sp.]
MLPSLNTIFNFLTCSNCSCYQSCCSSSSYSYNCRSSCHSSS